MNRKLVMVTNVKDTMDERLLTYRIKLMNKAREIMSRKEDGGKEVIVELVLVAVAIGVALLWKQGLGTTVNSLITSFTTKITTLFSGT